MPIVSFSALPDESRVWVFGSDPSLPPVAADRLLGEVDRFLDGWKAHGVPLTCARDWRHDRFLAIAVDTTQESASGCSIDGLYRTLQGLERALGARLVAGGRVFYRDASGRVQSATREQFAALAAEKAVSAETPVFDTSLTNAGALRRRFEAPARESWVAALLAPAAPVR